MTLPNPAEAAALDLIAVRTQAPLVHNITNYVVMNFTANALLALGASPVMAHAREEVADMVGIASALVINIGTLSPPWIDSMTVAMAEARRLGKPTVLDPVGAGATRFRTDTALALLGQGPTVVRGNASEILALTSVAQTTRGVDATVGTEAADAVATELAVRAGTTLCISGAEDLIIDGHRRFRVANGDPWMSRVTGMGCAATAIVGAFAAVNPDPALAARHAMAVIGIAGELARARARGPGSFAVEFLDALAGLDADQVRALARIR
jgi:hydroxyethylthiazole kinase